MKGRAYNLWKAIEPEWFKKMEKFSKSVLVECSETTLRDIFREDGNLIYFESTIHGMYLIRYKDTNGLDFIKKQIRKECNFNELV